MNEQTNEDDHGYRVLFLLRLKPGSAEEFLHAYEKVRWEVASLPGHRVDQVCQSTEDPDDWLITSEWHSAADFLEWERSPGHRELAAPMLACVVERRSVRFTVRRETRVEE
ncbi:antibiotic biosynthesis monooxygenase family protein [Micromonospora carbonacea]|uniref:Antibiotic biosynthesis monooxygenase n=1 Tax=Micromonospora carbonacea TaxID=47853 RepID=A0A1C4VDY5_9ACTN|nr:antibiotic biosynthesis monooxygenase family protein [Micromonospora carbonacea]SCE82152.1 Antibiotic biosynthesis monooxygenase [Micromonospora carbonacea]